LRGRLVARPRAGRERPDPQQRSANVVDDQSETPIVCRLARDDDVVESGEREIARLRDGGAKPAPDAISDNGTAELLGHGVADAGCGGARRMSRGTSLSFDRTGSRSGAKAATDGEKIGSRFDRWKRGDGGTRWVRAGVGVRQGSGLRRQALAALGAATGNNAAATGRLHALAKAVSALAHESARLIRTFHVKLRRRPIPAEPRRFVVLYHCIRSYHRCRDASVAK
jgi:hypothetical protein